MRAFLAIAAAVLLSAQFIHALPVGDAPKVKLDLYFESLCPGCRGFITTQMKTVFATEGLSDILDWNMFPYGNAQESQGSSGQYQFECQHGADECAGNLIETCAINLAGRNNTMAWWPFVLCVESAGEAPAQAAPGCAKQHNVDMDAVSKCAQSSQGNQWEHEMAKATAALSPAHTYVPWLVLNGEHTEAMQNKLMDNAVQAICEAYTGTKPAACSSIKGDAKCYK